MGYGGGAANGDRKAGNFSLAEAERRLDEQAAIISAQNEMIASLASRITEVHETVDAHSNTLWRVEELLLQVADAIRAVRPDERSADLRFWNS